MVLSGLIEADMKERKKKHAMHRFVELINIQRCGYETKQGAGRRKHSQVRSDSQRKVHSSPIEWISTLYLAGASRVVVSIILFLVNND